VVGPYRGLFSTPGVKGFVIAGFVGRMPMSMLGIGIILLIETLTDSWAIAGAVAATVNLSFAVAGPLSGRLVDRFGQARVIVPLVLTHGAALTGMMLCVEYGTPQWTLFATGAVVGATAVSLGSLVRARSSHLLAGSARLHAAFSFACAILAVAIGVSGSAWLRTPVAQR
jgi:MFS family permease